MEKGNKKIITAWTFYDWANSVYNLVITATILPIYYKAVTVTMLEISFPSISLVTVTAL